VKGVYIQCVRWSWASGQHKTNEWILCQLKVDRELLDRVKSLKLGFYGHTTRKYESFEKEIVQGCVPSYRYRGRQTPALDRWHRWMDWDEDQWSGCSSGRSWSLERDTTRRQPFLWRKALNDDHDHNQAWKHPGRECRWLAYDGHIVKIAFWHLCRPRTCAGVPRPFHTCRWPTQSTIAAFCRHRSPGSAYQQTVDCW